MNRCTYCGHEGNLLWVHGHGQCARCGINVAPCCDGESCAPPEESCQDHPSA